MNSVLNINKEIVAATGNIEILAADVANFYTLFTDGTVSLTGNTDVVISDTPYTDQIIPFLYKGRLTPNAFGLTILGNSIPNNLLMTNFYGLFIYNGSAWDIVTIAPNFKGESFISNSSLVAASISNANLANLTRGSMKVGDSSNRPIDVAFNASGYIPIGDGSDLNSVPVSGDAGLASNGVLTIASGAINNAKVAANAGIVVTKLDTLSDGQFLMGNGGNVKQAISGSLAVSAAGVATLNGNAAIETFVIPVSFAAGEQCSNKFFPGFAGTIVSMVAYVTKEIAGTDEATITASINGTGVTDGVITLPASSILDASESAAPSALNTFDADDVISLVSLKTTAGGTALVTVQCSRV